MTGTLLLLLPSAIGLHVGTYDRISIREVLEVSEQVQAALEARTGQDVRIDAVDWAQCDAFDACADGARARMQVDEVVLLRVFGGPLQIFVEARREVDGEERKASGAHPKSALTPAAFAPLVAALFPPGPARAPPRAALGVVATASVAAPAADYTAPLVVGGVSVALAAVGVGLGLSSRGASQTAMQSFLPPSEHEATVGRADEHALAANVLFGAAAAGAVTALVLWLVD